MRDGNGSGGVGRSLRSLREAHSLACSELAARVGVTPEGLRAIESGATLPSAAVLLRLSEFFAVEPCYFFGAILDAGKPEPSDPTRLAPDELDHLGDLVDRETLGLLAALSRSVRKPKG